MAGLRSLSKLKSLDLSNNRLTSLGRSRGCARQLVSSPTVVLRAVTHLFIAFFLHSLIRLGRGGGMLLSFRIIIFRQYCALGDVALLRSLGRLDIRGNSIASLDELRHLQQVTFPHQYEYISQDIYLRHCAGLSGVFRGLFCCCFCVCLVIDVLVAFSLCVACFPP